MSSSEHYFRKDWKWTIFTCYSHILSLGDLCATVPVLCPFYISDQYMAFAEGTLIHVFVNIKAEWIDYDRINCTLIPLIFSYNNI